jgi:RNA polymerase sigma-70 factor (ECF subfamily)
MLSDEAAFEKLLNGEMDAFDLLYERYEKSLFGFICRFIGDRNEAEDIFHETFMAVIRERDYGHRANSFRAWLFQVARHRCLNRLRSCRRAKAFVQVAVQSETLVDNQHPESAIQSREALRCLQLAVARLPEDLAELFQLRSSGMSYDEISQVLEIPVGTVKSRMHQMVALLRDEVQK